MKSASYSATVNTLVCLLSICSTHSQETSGSDSNCVIPPYASIIPQDISPGELGQVMTEGRCFLACLEQLQLMNLSIISVGIIEPSS